MNTQSVNIVVGVIIAIIGYIVYNQPPSSPIGWILIWPSEIGLILIAFGVLAILFSGYKSQ